jgi:hypothetical protein
MKPLWLVLVGVAVGWAASGVDWTHHAVGQEGPLLRANAEASILTEHSTLPEAVPAVEADRVEIHPFMPQFSGRYQIVADAGACYRMDTATGRVWHITLHMKPRIVADAVEGEIMR